MPSLNPKDIARLKKDLKEINDIYDKIGKTKIEVDFNVENDLETFKLIKMELADAKTYINDITDGFGSLQDSVVAITRDWNKGFANPTKEATKSMSKLKGLTEKLADDKNRIVRLSTKELEKIKESAKAESARLDEVLRRLKARKSANEALTTAEEVILANLEKGYRVQDDIIKQTSDRIKQEERISKLTGLTGEALDGAAGFAKKIGLNISSDKFKKLSDGARDFANELENGNEGLKEGDKGYLDESTIQAKVLGKTLTDGAKVFKKEMLLALDVKLLQGFKKGLKEFGESREALAKTFALGRGDANELKTSLNIAANDSGEMHFNIADAVKGIQEFNAEIGGAVKLTQEELKTFSLLSNEFGLTNKQAAELVKSSKLRGENADDMMKKMRGQVMVLQAQEGSAINQQEVFASIGDISAANRLTMQGQGKELANAAYQSAKLGLSQSQIEKTTNSLLDFESSIAAEMEAELMTGKQLNLEDARRAALMGDQEGLAKAISREIGTSAEFGSMNLLQQQSLAKAFGMSREELAETLETQELLGGQFKSMGDAQAKYNKMKKDGLSDEAIAAKLGNDQLNDQLKAEAASVRFKDAMIKFKDQLVPIIELFGKFLDKLMDGLESFQSIKGVVTAIGKGIAIIAGIRMFGRLSMAIKSFQKILSSIGGISKASSKLPTALGGTGGAGAVAKSTTGGAAGALTKSGKPDMRFKANKGLGGAAKGGGGISSKIGGFLKGMNPLNKAKDFLGKNATKFLKGGVKKIPILGSLIEGIFAATDISSMMAEGGDEAKVNQMIGKRTAEAIGSIGGMGLGGFLGSFIPIPGVGTFLGAMAGDALGRWAGGALADAVGAEGLGKMVQSAFSGGGDTAEDFISRPGQPIQKFRADDIIMGGTSLTGGGDSGEVVQLLKQLISAVNSGGDVYLDGNKVGKSLAIATSTMG